VDGSIGRQTFEWREALVARAGEAQAPPALAQDNNGRRCGAGGLEWGRAKETE